MRSYAKVFLCFLALLLFGSGCENFSPERLAAAFGSFDDEDSLSVIGKKSDFMPPAEKSKIITNEMFRAVVDEESVSALQKILDRGASYLLAANGYGDTPLGTAIKRQNPQAALYLLEQMTNDQLLHQNSKGEGYLYLAAAKSYKKILDLLSDKFYQSKEELTADYEFSDLDMETKEGEKALHAAGNSAIAEALESQYYRGFLEAPFRKFQYHLSRKGQSFIHTAARDRRSDVLRWGLRRNCKSQKEWQDSTWSSLFSLPSYGRLDWDSLINLQDKKGRTALNISAMNLFAEGVQILSQCVWTDYLLPDQEGNIPLHTFLRALDKNRLAHSREIKEAFFLLLRGQNVLKSWYQDSGDSANYANHEGESSLHAAARLADSFFYQELKKYGNVEIENKRRQTPKQIFQLTQSQIEKL